MLKLVYSYEPTTVLSDSYLRLFFTHLICRLNNYSLYCIKGLFFHKLSEFSMKKRKLSY